MKLTEEQIKIAVDWWKGVLHKPKFDTLGSTRNDPREQAAAMAEMMATVCHQSPHEQTIERFGEELATALHEWEDRYCQLDVDYHPCRLLHDAADKVGLDTGLGVWPWKTSMNLNEEGSVTVSYGYGAPREMLLEAPASD